ncbi:hypothetical protein FHR24_001718 [Wenyingzhuangia heitensis]|uniref:NlpE N-terminal domain-containing protein n=2 Tax=Wenyingzhuangia heitensis TaxID=1487859 RepID=A0ABX0UA84_9FLAO|nr:hypothetical protein [Wenyingzhuangia heitensis]
MKKLVLGILFMTIMSCQNDNDEISIDLSSFEKGRSVDFKNFSPKSEITYWEYSEECSKDTLGNFDNKIFYSRGKICITEYCKSQYQKSHFTHPFVDFLGGKCDNCCNEYLKYQINDSLISISTREYTTQNRLDFIGEINTLDEAIWMINHSGYTLTDNNIQGYMKVNKNDFEFIAKITTEYCEPTIIEKHHILINELGEIIILEKEKISEDNSPCPLN